MRALVLAALLACPAALALAKSPAELVVVERGTLPIVLTAPHGGREAIPGVAPRDVKRAGVVEDSRKWGGAVTSTDGNTDVLALRMAAEIRRLTGQAPYVVVAKFQRKFIDANRPAELAFDSPAALAYYDLYHRSIRDFVDEILRTHPAGLLIDVHGQNKDPGVLMRGTVNGRTVLKLVRRAGVGAITGPEGLFGRLEANGFKVFPANSEGLGARSEDAGLNGGYTTRLYGSDNAGGIDSVQFEFGTVYRRKEAVEKSAVDAARAVVDFHRAYLAKERGGRQ
jgi:N-formylglutamate amidohydrolase